MPSNRKPKAAVERPVGKGVSGKGMVSPWRTASQREQERRLKKEAILQTAATMFNDRGYDSTSLDDVATMLEVTKPTIYHYFADKKSILYECLRRGLEDIERIFIKAKDAPGSGADRLRVMMEKYSVAMTTDFGRCVIRMNDRDLLPEHRESIKAIKHSIAEISRGIVADGMADGSIVKGDVRITSFAIAGALNSIAFWHRPHRNLRVKEVTEVMMGVLLKGLAPRS